MGVEPTPTGPNVLDPHRGERRRDVLTCELPKLAPSPSGARDGTGALFARDAVDRAYIRTGSPLLVRVTFSRPTGTSLNSVEEPPLLATMSAYPVIASYWDWDVP